MVAVYICYIGDQHILYRKLCMKQRHAFTLIEFAVVLVIIGLLIGAVVEGGSIRHAQELRSATQDARNYALAIQTFTDRYGSLPGDMPDAVRIWGRADGGTDLTVNCADPATDASTGAPTCNGDGDGVIESSVAANPENFRAWQQLAAAGLIEGNYTGIGPGIALAQNVPASSLEQSYFYIQSLGTLSGSTDYFDGNYDNTLVLSSIPAPLLVPEDASEIDIKIDDGLPGSGNIRTPTQTKSLADYSQNCVTSDLATTARYHLGGTQPECILIFLQTFEQKPD